MTTNSPEVFVAEHIEADSDHSSEYGDSLISDTTSLSSSIYNYTFENGRRYQRSSTEGHFDLPNDEKEQDRLDLYHHMQLLLLKGRLFVSPIGENPQRILDCGTGTGIWALDMAETFPSAEVIGLDLSPIQPAWTFPNCHFQVDDLEKDWTFPEEHFDFIHSRGLQMSIQDWGKYLEQMYKHTKPGGYVELVEYDLNIIADDDSLKGSALDKYQQNFKVAAAKVGMKLKSHQDYKTLAEEAGFVDVQVHFFQQPFGTWPKKKELKELGAISVMITESGFEAHAIGLFTNVLGLSTEDAKKLCAGADDDMRNTRKKGLHPYNLMYHIVAKKPEPGSPPQS